MSDPRITDEVVELASAASWNCQLPSWWVADGETAQPIPTWDAISEEDREPYRVTTRAALEAAAPLLAPQPEGVLRKALQRLVDLKDGARDERYYNERLYAWNGAREALAVQTLAPQPVVDRESLAQAVAGHTRSEMYRGSEPEWWCPCGNWRTHDINEAVYGHARHVADLVLALLNGTAK
jgi:hypothetical protein